MATSRKFKFPIAVLVNDGDPILDIAETTPSINGQIDEPGYVAASRAVWTSITTLISNQKSGKAGTGTLTKAQNAALAVVDDLVPKLKDAAKRAFPDDSVKLRNEFQVGINKPTDLASVLERARIVAASAAKPANAAALAKKAWKPANTTALAAAIATLDTTDDTQETSKIDNKGDTSALYGACNDLYDRLLTIQGAADILFPDTPGNAVIRAKFKLDTFPPAKKPKKQEPSSSSSSSSSSSMP